MEVMEHQPRNDKLKNPHSFCPDNEAQKHVMVNTCIKPEFNTIFRRGTSAYMRHRVDTGGCHRYVFKLKILEVGYTMEWHHYHCAGLGQTAVNSYGYGWLYHCLDLTMEFNVGLPSRHNLSIQDYVCVNPMWTTISIVGVLLRLDWCGLGIGNFTFAFGTIGVSCAATERGRPLRIRFGKL